MFCQKEDSKKTCTLKTLFRADYNVQDSNYIMLEHPFSYLGLAIMDQCAMGVA